VLGPDGKLATLITQSHVVAFLDANISKLGGLATTPVHDLHLRNVWQPTVKVHREQRAIDCFRLMREHRVSGLPVVDQHEGGVLLGNISLHDIMAIGKEKDDFALLCLPVLDFLKRCSRRPGAVVTYDPREPLASVLAKIVTGRVHRIYYVTPNEGKLMGVVSLSDILKSIVAYT